MNRFSAVWSPNVRWVSVLITVLLLSITLFLWLRVHGAQTISLLPVVVLAGAALFTIRGYELAGHELLVQRLFWTTRIDLTGLERAWASPTDMRRAWRVFGNGGLYSISGLFKNKTLGYFRAFATNPQFAVILILPERTVVVTPAETREFIEALESRGLMASASAGE